ncbi:hypothetical protein Ancab_032731 [Ancistrocladus abbreviatus]
MSTQIFVEKRNTGLYIYIRPCNLTLLKNLLDSGIAALLSHFSLLMGSILGNWPSYDPHNFSQLRPSDPSNPSIHGQHWDIDPTYHAFGLVADNLHSNFEFRLKRISPATYHPTHNRTLPPRDQEIFTESKNILIRHFYKHAEEKLRPKRAASELLSPENGSKHPRASTSDAPL